MKKRIRLTERDLTRLIRRVVNEQDRGDQPATEQEALDILSSKIGATVPPNTDPQLKKGLCCFFGIKWCCDFKWPWDRKRY